MMLEECGYDMSYRDKRIIKRQYHEDIVVANDYRKKDCEEELEELSAILGIPYMIDNNNYKYPNRMRIRQLS